jgi:hypothetical protein
MDHCLTLPGGHRRSSGGTQRVLGEKPVHFVVWMLRCCCVAPTDEVIDVFPGSGAVAEAVDMWKRQGELAFGGA